MTSINNQPLSDEGTVDDRRLDVERLARAIAALAHGRCCWDPAEDARDLAREYARLTPANPSPSEPPRCQSCGHYHVALCSYAFLAGDLCGCPSPDPRKGLG